MDNLRTNKEIYDELEKEKKADCDYYMNLMQKCTKCESFDYISYKVIGRPGPKLIELAKTGIVKLGGCNMQKKNNHSYCRKCKE
jgi:hypothetical protein